MYNRWTLLLCDIFAVCVPRAHGDMGPFPAWLQTRDSLILKISLSLTEAQKRSLCWLTMSAAFCTVSLRQCGYFKKITECALFLSFLHDSLTTLFFYLRFVRAAEVLCLQKSLVPSNVYCSSCLSFCWLRMQGILVQSPSAATFISVSAFTFTCG